jgi:biopolymer transport protein ExbD
MKKHSMPEMKEGGVNVTPLIDIVMCLIIFFMLVAKIGVTRGVDKDIKLPSAWIGAPIKDLSSTLSLNVHDMGRDRPPQVTALVNDEKRDLPIFIEATKDRPLRKVLTEFKNTHPQKAQIIIRGDADLDYAALEQVLTEMSAAGVTDTAYETKVGDATTATPPPAAAP